MARDALPPTDAAVYLEAELRPHRSLSRTGFLLVMGAIVAASFLAGVFYIALGAWPVTGFFGLDLVLVWLAFRASYRQGRMVETVRVTADRLDVVRRRPSGGEQRWSLPSYWVRLRVDEPMRHDSQIEVVVHGDTVVLGAFLAPKERGRFAHELSAALAAAREERFAPQGSGGAAS